MAVHGSSMVAEHGSWAARSQSMVVAWKWQLGSKVAEHGSGSRI